MPAATCCGQQIKTTEDSRQQQLIATSAAYQINCVCRNTFSLVGVPGGVQQGVRDVTSCKCVCVSLCVGVCGRACVCACCHLMINCNKTLVIQKNRNKREAHEYDKWHFVLCTPLQSSPSSCGARRCGSAFWHWISHLAAA